MLTAYMRQVARETQIVNLYGMTETAGHTIAHNYGREETATRFGLPTDNADVKLLDNETRSHLGAGKGIGTIWVGGVGLTPGYLGSDLDVRFEWFDGKRYFDTGDMAELLPNGILRYAGRADRCVKISGFRIELDGVRARSSKYMLRTAH